MDGMCKMRKTLYLIALILLLAFPAIAGNAVYLAQTAAGGNTGADCNDAKAYTYFNTSGNWTAGTPTGIQIGAGTTVNLCGTFTASSGASGYLTFQGSGSSGLPVTLSFLSGATLTAPYWGSNGAIFAEGVNYIAVNGNGVGSVISTACGTANNSVACSTERGIYFVTVSNSSVQNVTLSNLYVNSGAGTDENGQNTYGVEWSGGSNITISGNTCHDVRTCLFYGYSGGGSPVTSSGVTISGNTVYNINWGIIVGDGSSNAILNAQVNVFGNTIYNFSLWDDTSDLNHHDGIYGFATHTGSQLNAFNAYGNYIYGDPGLNGNAWIYVSQNSGLSGVACTANIFNNILVNTGAVGRYPANGLIQDWCTAVGIYNNTMAQNSATNTTSGNICIAENLGVQETLYNNVCTTTYLDDYLVPSVGTLTASDYNDWYSQTYVGANNAGTYYASLANWLTCVANGCPSVHDTHSISQPTNFNGSYVPNTNSLLIGAALNLSYISNGQPNPGLGALGFDFSGNARPSSGNWTMGANNAASSPPVSATVLPYNGWCMLGDQFPVTFGTPATLPFYGSFPQCTVSVYLTGTSNLATLYSSSTLTPLSNPFTANADSSYLFWAAVGIGYDVTVSGGSPYTMPVAKTTTDIYTGNSSGTGLESLTTTAPLTGCSGGCTATATIGVSPATTSATGVIELANDLCGSGTFPEVCGLHAVPFCTGFTPTTGQVLSYVTTSSPNPCYTAVAQSGGSGGGNPTFDNCTPDETATSPFYSVITLSNIPLEYASWQFQTNSLANYIACTIYIATAQTGATIVLDIASADNTAGHTMTFIECDADVTTGTLNIITQPCGSGQTFTTTTTAYARNTFTFNIQSTLSSNSLLMVRIIATSASGMLQPVLVYPHFIL